MPTTEERIRKTLDILPQKYRGPGGAAAILKDGELVDHRVWGYADLDNRVVMEPDTPMPICSITKQFLCMLCLDLQRNPPATMAVGKGDFLQQLSDALRDVVGPESELTIQHLWNMQSGIRDYYAMSVLWGARPGGPFSLDDREPLDRIISFMFKPGTQYSYSNPNFHTLGRLVEKVAGQPLGDLMRDRLFPVMGMSTATYCPDNSRLPGPCVGYEGTEKLGFITASNTMEWSGDAGIVVTLKDMIAYEQYVDRSWQDPNSLYRTIAQPQVFADGEEAHYGCGLMHHTVKGVPYNGHGGALPGFRLRRLYVPSERLSIIVLFNHEADAADASEWMVEFALDLPDEILADPSASYAEWSGYYLDHASGLVVQVTADSGPGITLSYSAEPEHLTITSKGHAVSRDAVAELDGDSLTIRRYEDNVKLRADRLPLPLPLFAEKENDYAGQYRCEELNLAFHCTGERSLLYGSFDGYLGAGPAHLMRPLSSDVWALACPRGLDAPAPGDWTVIFHRDEEGVVSSVQVGCWLARNIRFLRVN